MTSQKSGKTVAIRKFLALVDQEPDKLALYERFLVKAGEEIPAQVSEFFETLESEDKIRLEDLGGFSGGVNLAYDKS